MTQSEVTPANKTRIVAPGSRQTVFSQCSFHERDERDGSADKHFRLISAQLCVRPRMCVTRSPLVNDFLFLYTTQTSVAPPMPYRHL